MKLLSVVFSFRNEEGNIKELVDRINILTASHHEPSTWNSCEKRSFVLVCFKAWMA